MDRFDEDPWDLTNEQLEALRKGWEDLLRPRSFEWTWWVTLSFKDRRTSMLRAKRRWTKWLRSVERCGLQGQARRRGLPWAYVIEGHRDGNPHLHAVVAGCAHLAAGPLEDLWPHGLAAVERLDAPLGY
jgi:hypothetical protein